MIIRLFLLSFYYLYSHAIIINENTLEKYAFLVSVIIPIYNTARYLPHTFDCLESQTIGFRQNIQVILINDGSTDNSHQFCQAFKQRYPENILYIQQSNLGVSAARNAGLQYVRGKYITFFDSDDLWSPNAFAALYTFFEKHYLDVDVVSARIKMFDAYERYQEIDYKFSETRLINLRKDYKYIQLAVHSTFIKASALENEDRFSIRLKYGEDTLFINTILLRKCKLGVVREAEYYHRKRRDKSSALNMEAESPSYLFDSPIFYHQHLFNLSRQMYGITPRFIQYTIMYEIKWRLLRPVRVFLTDAENTRYCNLIIQSLQNIDDDIILEQTGTPLSVKLLTLSQKHGKDIRDELHISDSTVLYHSVPIIRLENNKDLLRCISWRINRNILNMECIDKNILDVAQYRYTMISDGDPVASTIVHNTEETVQSMFGPVEISRKVLFRIQLKKYSSTILHPILLLVLDSTVTRISLGFDTSYLLRRLSRKTGHYKIIVDSEKIQIIYSSRFLSQMIGIILICTIIYKLNRRGGNKITRIMDHCFDLLFSYIRNCHIRNGIKQNHHPSFL